MVTTTNATESTGTEPPRAAPAAPPGPIRIPPRRLYRDPNGPIGGVAGGIAAYFDIDPVIPRVIWIMALLSGIGLPAYAVCWIVIPKATALPASAGPSRASAGSMSRPQERDAVTSGR